MTSDFRLDKSVSDDCLVSAVLKKNKIKNGRRRERQELGRTEDRKEGRNDGNKKRNTYAKERRKSG